MHYLLLIICGFLSACTHLPDNVKPINNFELQPYLGKWYEVARLDHSFERDMNQVSATYSMREDGGVKVINTGFNQQKQEWQTAEGKAYFVENENIGHLKVSFFGPFYGSYAIFELNHTKQYAFVAGYNHDYLWLLSRTPTVSQQVKQHFINQSTKLGFDANQLIWPTHSP